MSLRKKLEGLHARQNAIAAEMKALGESDDEGGIAVATIEELNQEFEENEKQIAVLEKACERAEGARNRMLQRITPAGETPFGQADDVGFDKDEFGSVGEALAAWDKIRLPPRAQFIKSKVYSSDKAAFFSGMAICAMCGSRKAKKYLSDVGYELESPRNAMEGGTDSLGGYAVPHPMAAEIIRLVEEYGVFRRYSRVMPMTSATLDVPKRTAGLTVYYPGEGNAITPSDLTFGQVNLVAKKAAQLAIWSTELDEDAIISMTDLITVEIAWAFAQAEDTNSFLGDGSAPFNSITGILNALQAGAKVTADGGAGAATWDGILLPTYHEMVGKIQMYPGVNPVWFINHQGFAESMQALMYAAGGNTVLTMGGPTGASFLGYPVVKTQVLTRDPSAAGQLLAVFGDLRLGSMLGNRRDITMQILRELYAASDQIGMVSTMRTDTVIHDVGDASDAGCIVGLISP